MIDLAASTKSRPQRLILLFTLSLVVLSSFAECSTSVYAPSNTVTADATTIATQDSIAIISTLNAALNSHDVDSALTLFSQDATVIDLAGMACPVRLVQASSEAGFCQATDIAHSGREEVRGWLERLVDNHIQLQEMGENKITANNITWIVSVTVDEYRRLNIAPLTVHAEAMIQNDRILMLTFILSASSTAKLAAALVTERPVIGRIMIVGAVAMFVIAIFYILRIKNTFSSIPRLEKPWIVLEGGVALLFLGVLMIAYKDLLGITFTHFEELDDSLIAVAAVFILAAMVMMKRAWTVSEGE